MATGEIKVKVIPDTKILDKDLKKKRKIGLLPDFGGFNIKKSLGLDKIFGKVSGGGVGVAGAAGGAGATKGITGILGKLGIMSSSLLGILGFVAIGASVLGLMKPIMSLFKAILVLLFLPLIPVLLPAMKAIAKFIPILAKTMNKVKDFVAKFVDILGDGISWVWENILQPIVEGLFEAFEPIFNGLKNMWENFLLPAIQVLAGIFKKIFDLILTFFVGTIDVVTEVWGLISSFFKGEISVKELVWGFIKSLFKGFINSVELVWGFIKLLFKGSIEVTKSVWGFIKSLFKGTVNVAKIIGGWINSFFTGSKSGSEPEKKAMGGSVSANTPFIVGERGPELFIPSSSGRIIPNNQISGNTGGGGTTIHNTFQLGPINNEMDINRIAQRIAEINKDELAMSTGSQRF